MKRLGPMTLVLALAVLYGCSGPQQRADIGEADDLRAAAVSEYLIGVDDQVRVSVWGNPELSIDMPVRPDGMITLPLIGDIQAGGRTPQQVSSEIAERLEHYIRSPQVTVILTELRSHEYLSRVRVTGAVAAPLSMPFRQGMTVLDAVLAAGGLNEFAAPNRTSVYRNSGETPQVFGIQLGRILNEGDLKTNIQLRPGDVITVPERFF